MLTKYANINKSKLPISICFSFVKLILISKPFSYCPELFTSLFNAFHQISNYYTVEGLIVSFLTCTVATNICISLTITICIYISQIIVNSFCSFCHCTLQHYQIMQITVQIVKGCLGHWWRHIQTPTIRCHCSITLTVLTKSNKCPFI